MEWDIGWKQEKRVRYMAKSNALAAYIAEQALHLLAKLSGQRLVAHGKFGVDLYEHGYWQ